MSIMIQYLFEYLFNCGHNPPMTTHHTDEKKPALGGLSDEAQQELAKIAEEMRRRARAAFLSADKQEAPVGGLERRFIEHGGMCYFNCWSLLQKFLDDASPPPSTIQEEE